MVDEKKPSSFVSKDEFQTQEQVPFEKSEAEIKFVSKMNRHFIPFVCIILFLQVRVKTKRLFSYHGNLHFNLVY